MLIMWGSEYNCNTVTTTIRRFNNVNDNNRIFENYELQFCYANEIV